jgi:hypothetical protein
LLSFPEGVALDFALAGGGKEAQAVIAWLNLLRLVRIVRLARFCKLLCDVFARKRSDLVMMRSKAIKAANRKYKKGEYTLRDPNKEKTISSCAKMSLVMKGYTLAKKRHHLAPGFKWVSRKEAKQFGKKNARPRRIKTFEGKYRRKMFGEEEEGSLYSVRNTTMDEISQHFGLSIGLYFHTLHQCCKFFILIFVVSTPAVFSYYAAQKKSTTVLPPQLLGTAVCTDFETVMTEDGKTIDSCISNPTNANVAAAFLVLPMIFFFVKSYRGYVEAVIAEIDGQIISAQDFAIEVMDPNDDAFDPGAFHICHFRFQLSPMCT